MNLVLFLLFLLYLHQLAYLLAIRGWILRCVHLLVHTEITQPVFRIHLHISSATEKTGRFSRNLWRPLLQETLEVRPQAFFRTEIWLSHNQLSTTAVNKWSHILRLARLYWQPGQQKKTLPGEEQMLSSAWVKWVGWLQSMDGYCSQIYSFNQGETRRWNRWSFYISLLAQAFFFFSPFLKALCYCLCHLYFYFLFFSTNRNTSTSINYRFGSKLFGLPAVSSRKQDCHICQTGSHTYSLR